MLALAYLAARTHRHRLAVRRAWHTYLVHPVQPFTRPLRFIGWLLWPLATHEFTIPKTWRMPVWARGLLLRCCRPSWHQYGRWLRSTAPAPQPPRAVRRALGRPRRRKGVPDAVAAQVGELAYRPRAQGRLQARYWATAPAPRPAAAEPKLVGWRRLAAAAAVGALLLPAGAAMAAEQAAHKVAAHIDQQGVLLTQALPDSAALVPGDIEMGSFVKATVTGNQDVTIATDGTGFGTGTWAILFWTCGSASATGVWAATGGVTLPTMGMVANGGGSITQYVASSESLQAGAPDTQRYMSGAAALGFVNLGGTALVDAATFVAFQSSTTMRLNWSANGTGVASHVNYMIISGLTNAKVITKAVTATGSNGYTGAGFTPELVILFGHYLPAGLPSGNQGSSLGWGTCNSAGEQWANSWWATDGGGTTNTSRWQRTDKSFVLVGATEADAGTASWVSMDADGFTLTHPVVTNPTQIVALCMAGIQSKIGSFNTGSTPQTVTHNANFTVKGGLFTSLTMAAAVTSANAGVTWALAGTDGTNHYGFGFMDIDGSGTANTQSMWTSTQSLLMVDVATVYNAGTMAFTSNTTMTATLSPNGAGGAYFYLLMAPRAGNTHQVINAT